MALLTRTRRAESRVSLAPEPAGDDELAPSGGDEGADEDERLGPGALVAVSRTRFMRRTTRSAKAAVSSDKDWGAS